MKLCKHMVRDEGKMKCSVGIEPMKCHGCSMFGVRGITDREGPVASTLSSPSPTSLSTAENGVFMEDGKSAKIVQAASVKGGCGCRKH